VQAVGLAALASADRQQAQSSKLKKVIQMLEKMSAEGKEAMNAEQVAWATRSQFCSDEIDRLSGEVDDDKADIEEAEGTAAAAQGQAEALAKQIADDTAELAELAAQKKAAAEERAASKAKHLEVKTDLEESVEALGSAIRVIEAALSRTKNVEAVSLLQSESLMSKIPEKAQGLVLELVELESGDSRTSYAYNSKSGRVVEILEKTEEEFKQKLHEEETAEINRRHNHEVVMQTIVDETAGLNASVEDNTIAKQKNEAKAASNLEKAETAKASLAANTKDFTATKRSCKHEKLSYDEKQQVREDEITAIGQAVKVLKSAPQASLAQIDSAKPASLLQIKSIDTNNQENAAKISLFLRHQSVSLKSKTLSLLSEKLAVDPFVKVKQMIEEMINKLHKEAKEEAAEHTYCMTEFGKNKKKRTTLTRQFNEYQAEADLQNAEAATLKEKISEISDRVAKAKAVIAEEKDLRSKAHELFKKEHSDAEDGVAAVTAAIGILQDFYAQAAGATAFVQLKQEPEEHPFGEEFQFMGTEQENAVLYGAKKGQRDSGHQEGMETFGDKFSGSQDTAAAIIAILETCQLDLSKEKAELETVEADSKATFDDLIQDKNVAIAKGETELEFLKKKKVEAETAAADAAGSAKQTGKELKSVEAQYKALLPECPASAGGTKDVITFEERQEQRQAEIDSLKQALEMLAP
jgi:hypothetical protein